MLKTFIIISSVIGLTLLAVLLLLTTPATAGPFGVLAIFISAYLALVGIISYALYLVSILVAHLSITFIARRPFEPLSLKKSYYYSTVVGSAPIMLIGLQSVGAVGIYEVALVLLFVVIGCIYVSKKVG